MKNDYRHNGDGTTTIFLQEVDGKRLETLIDTVDFALADSMPIRWHARIINRKYTKYYYVAAAPTIDGKRKRLQLHRMIMKPKPGLFVDHMDHDTLNNTRSNLRNVTPTENVQNCQVHRPRANPTLGVYLRRGRFIAYMCKDGKTSHIGSYKTLEEAEEATVRARIAHMPGYIPESRFQYLVDEIDRERGFAI